MGGRWRRSWRRPGLFCLARQPSQLLFQDVMVIAPSGIHRHRRPLRMIVKEQRVFFRSVILSNNDNTARLRPEPLWPDTAFPGLGHPAHIAVIAVRQIRFKVISRIAVVGCGEPYRIEPFRQHHIADSIIGI